MSFDLPEHMKCYRVPNALAEKWEEQHDYNPLLTAWRSEMVMTASCFLVVVSILACLVGGAMNRLTITVFGLLIFVAAIMVIFFVARPLQFKADRFAGALDKLTYVCKITQRREYQLDDEFREQVNRVMESCVRCLIQAERRLARVVLEGSSSQELQDMLTSHIAARRQELVEVYDALLVFSLVKREKLDSCLAAARQELAEAERAVAVNDPLLPEAESPPRTDDDSPDIMTDGGKTPECCVDPISFSS